MVPDVGVGWLVDAGVKVSWRPALLVGSWVCLTTGLSPGVVSGAPVTPVVMIGVILIFEPRVAVGALIGVFTAAEGGVREGVGQMRGLELKLSCETVTKQPLSNPTCTLYPVDASPLVNRNSKLFVMPASSILKFAVPAFQLY